MRGILSGLARRAWDQHERAERELIPHLVRPSIPILFFGDSDHYAESPLRVITVGLNPSREEFPRRSPFLRFPDARGFTGDDPPKYLTLLDGYFRTAPYTRWFNSSFEPLLRGLGTSYYDGVASTALHTDLCSPLATDPTWSRLTAAEREVLEPAGRALWHDLVDALQPDLVLISLARKHLSKIGFPPVEPVSLLRNVDGPDRVRPYRVEGCRRQLASGKAPLFVFGRASQTPFGSISRSEKQRIGNVLVESLDA